MQGDPMQGDPMNATPKAGKPLKLLLCCEFYHPSRGGVQEVMRQLAERFAAAGHDVTVATTAMPPAQLPRAERRKNRRIRHLGQPGARPGRRSRTLPRLPAQLRWRRHAHQGRPAMDLRTPAGPHSTPWPAERSSSPADSRPSTNRIMRRILPNCRQSWQNSTA